MSEESLNYFEEYEKDLVSIITPAYNCEEYIGRTIQSVINQTYTNWELIIVDDASTDNTKQVAEAFNDSRIVYVKLEKNSGAAVARTKGMKLAKGQYIAFLDCDDIWYKDKLQLQLDFMKKNNYAFTCTAYEQIDENDNKLGRVIKTKEKTDYNLLLLMCPVGNSTVMFDASKMGKFEVPNIRKRNDDALWLKMLKVEKYIWGMPEVLVAYRIRKSSLSHNKLALAKYHWYLYRKIEHLSIFRSCFHMVAWVFIKLFRLK